MPNQKGLVKGEEKGGGGGSEAQALNVRLQKCLMKIDNALQ
jgi:hypothetical protein